ncbi:MAG: flagellar basal-body rod protein FlgB [Peptococcaceae bacterium BRH_c4a]|nr:MAG: flagellar basal-body rod protein FlgB [Peptococcaceae bacterium BRH_c4a]
MNLFDSPVMVALSRQLDSSALTQRIIANNVANVNTPGFKKYYVSFQDQLRRALDSRAPVLATSNPRHIGGAADISQVAPRVVQERDTIMRYGRNNVDIDQEMVNLAANQIVYDFSAGSLSGKLGILGYVIRGGR